MEREFHTSFAVHEARLPVPAADRIVEVEVDGKPGIAFERIDGRPTMHTFPAKPWKLFELARQMAEVHAAMHSCELPDLPTRHERLANGIRAAVPLPPAMKQAALEALDQLPGGNAVCHGDLHPDNIMLSAKGLVVIDWAGGAG